MTDKTRKRTGKAKALNAGGSFSAKRRRTGRYLANAPLLEETGPPRLLTMSLILICALVAGLIAWSAVSVVPESVSAQAEIRPVGSVHVVQHLEGGIVADVLVRDGEIVAGGHNRTVADADPTAHAEVVTIRAAADTLGDWRLLDTTLYVTLEPCAMCAGAIVLARVPRVVYACSGQGLRDLIGRGTAVPCRQILQRPQHSIEVLGPLLEEVGLALHRRLRWWAGA